MWSARLRLYTRTSVWRLTLVFTCMVLLVTASVLGIVYWQTLGDRSQQLERNVLVAAQTYSELAASPTLGAEAMQQLVADRTRRSATMVLALQSGGRMHGNLSSLPEGLAQYPGTGRFPVVVSDLQGTATVSIAVGTRLPTPVGTLVVGLIDDDDQQQLQADYLLASLVALFGAMLFTLVAGFLFNLRVVGRVARLGEQMAEVQAGRLDSRLPVSARHDEFDVIAGQINGMLDEIDELLQSVVSVTDNIAHDLRTPLSRIRLRLEEQATTGSEEQAWLADVMVDLDQVLDTFEAMLELSRMEHGAGKLELRECELHQICSDVVDLLAPVAEAQEQVLTLTLDVPAQVPGDRSLLFRAVYNLVDNAIKHAGPGSTIRVCQDGRQIVVADNGPGIPEADRERVFRRLCRLDQSRHTAGTGLGLSIVRAVAELHHARVVLADANPGLKATLSWQ